jgi:hypothetical protein
MNPITRTKRARTAAVGAVLSLSSVIGLSATVAEPASAAAYRGTLTIRPTSNSLYAEVTVQGDFRMPRAQAEAVLASGRARVNVFYRGDDPLDDDWMGYTQEFANRGKPVYLWVSDRGLGLYFREEVDKAGTLDEDPEGRDEIFVKASLDLDGFEQGYGFDTNVVTGSF